MNIFTFDIENRGKSPSRHGILAVGLVIGNQNGDIIFKKQWNLEKLFETQDFELRCIDEFWSKQPKELLESLMQNQVSAKQFAQEFRELLNKYENGLYILSDNPTFDAGFINYYLDHFGLDSMQYGSNGKSYRIIHDSDSYACGAVHAPLSYNWPSDDEIALMLGFKSPDKSHLMTHNPTDDASKIYLQFIAVIKAVSNESVFNDRLNKLIKN
jgi:3' exoribonuclease, RNase T-like